MINNGICGNCGADAGLHHYETMQCPKNGIEETRFDRLSNKFYPQQWEETTFIERTATMLKDAAPELLDALEDLLDAVPKQDEYHDWWNDDLTRAVKKARAVIAKIP